MKNIFILILSIIIFYLFFGNVKEAFSSDSNHIPVIYKFPITLFDDTSSVLIYNDLKRKFSIMKCESSNSCENLSSLVKLTKIYDKYYLTTYTAPESGSTNFILSNGAIKTLLNTNFSTSSTKIPREAVHLDNSGNLVQGLVNNKYLVLAIDPKNWSWELKRTAATKFTTILQV